MSKFGWIKNIKLHHKILLELILVVTFGAILNVDKSQFHCTSVRNRIAHLTAINYFIDGAVGISRNGSCSQHRY